MSSRLTAIVVLGCALQYLVLLALAPSALAGPGDPPWPLIAAGLSSLVTVALARVHVARVLSPLREFALRLRAMAQESDWERSLRAPALLAAEGGIEELDAVRRRILTRIENSQRLRKQAEDASAYKTDFLKSVRHELKTPLNSILGFADILLSDLDGPLTEGQRENLGVIRDSGQRLSDLFNEVIDIATMASGDYALEIESVDVARLIDDVADSLERGRGSRPVHVRRELDEHVPAALGDRTRLSQMLHGLASHALEVTRGPELVLSVAQAPIGVRLCVRDPSRVLTQDELLTLREVDTPALKRKGLDAASRLRLQLCQRLAEAHGGRLSIDSDADSGTRFSVDLPTAERA